MSKRKPHRPHIAAISRAYAEQRQADEAALQQPMTDDQIGDLCRAYRLAFNAMLIGGADEQQWSTCVCSLNIALVLCEYGLGAECIPQINAALEGAFRARIRATRTGAWGFDGDAITTIKAAYEIHEAQLDAATKAELRDAIAEVRRRVDAGNVFQEAA